jgi:hypothetical protein
MVAKACFGLDFAVRSFGDCFSTSGRNLRTQK